MFSFGVFQYVNLINQPKPKRIRNTATLVCFCLAAVLDDLRFAVSACWLPSPGRSPSVCNRPLFLYCKSNASIIGGSKATRQLSMGGAFPISITLARQTMRRDVMVHFLWPLIKVPDCTLPFCFCCALLNSPAWIRHGDFCTSNCFVALGERYPCSGG